MNTKPLRAALYARFSTDKQKKESIDDQIRECERVALAHGFKVVERFSDAAISGGTAERPAYQKMLTAARAGKFDVLVAEDISRLWRNRAEFGPRSAELEDLKVHMVTAVGDDTRKDGWGLTIQIKLAMAEHARREASYRTRRGLEGKARDKKSAGGRAYGYIAKDKTVTINEDEARIVRQIYEWRVEGFGARTIAKKLNAANVPAPGANWQRKDEGRFRKTRDKGWRTSAITGDPTRGTGILNNPRYKGLVTWGRSKWTRSAANSNDRKWEMVAKTEDWVQYTDRAQQIVTPALWDRVHTIQTARSARRNNVRKAMHERKLRAGAGRGPGYWLSSILICKECGSNLIGYGARDYICPTYGVGKCTNNLRIRRDDAHLEVFELIKRELVSEPVMAAVQKDLEAQLRRLDKDQSTVTEASGEVAALDSQVARLRKSASVGDLSPAVAHAAIQQAERERDAATSRINARRGGQLRRAYTAVEAIPRVMQKYRDQVQHAMRVVADPKRVHEAREETRQWLEDGRIELQPNAKRTALLGTVRLKGLGAQVLGFAGVNKVVAGVGFEPTTFGL